MGVSDGCVEGVKVHHLGSYFHLLGCVQGQQPGHALLCFDHQREGAVDGRGVDQRFAGVGVAGHCSGLGDVVVAAGGVLPRGQAHRFQFLDLLGDQQVSVFVEFCFALGQFAVDVLSDQGFADAEFFGDDAGGDADGASLDDAGASFLHVGVYGVSHGYTSLSLRDSMLWIS